MPRSLATSGSELPAASLPSACRSLRMISSGECLLPNFESPPSAYGGLGDSHRNWIKSWGSGHDFSILEGSLHTLTPPTPTPVFTFGVNRPYWTKPVYGREVRFFFESNGFAYTDNLLDLFINENGVEHRRPITAAAIRPAAASVTKFCCWLVGLQKRQVLSLLRWYFGC